MKENNIDYGPNYKDYGIIGQSEKMIEIVSIVKTVAKTDISVLITGESGTGKEIVSRLVHKLSNRASHKFIAINCGAIPEGLIENELFGHEKGSYTSASEKKEGYFKFADKGTVFLDEIGELPLSSQVKLLRVLENGSFLRVGGTQEIKVDIRIVAATNKNLSEMVSKGQFREDLYYRLKAISLKIPPLRERGNDINLFVNKFSIDYASQNNIPKVKFSNGALAEIANYPWKGNIRELKNFVEMLTVMEGGNNIDSQEVRFFLMNEKKDLLHLPALIDNSPNVENHSELILSSILEIKQDLKLIKKIMFSGISNINSRGLGSNMIYNEIDSEYQNIDHSQEEEEDEYINLSERDKIVSTLNKYNGNRRKTAKELDMSERTLYRKLIKYGLK